MSGGDPERLACALAATRYQREWFADLQAQVDVGTPYALVNADTPHELLRALDIPYVVNQWWASVVAAKQAAPAHLARLRERGYPDHTEQYSSLSLASLLAPDPAADPWGGLPAPALMLADTTGDVTRKVFEEWQRLTGTPVHLLEHAAEDPVEERWWDLVPHDWERVVGRARVDLMHEELLGLVRVLEEATGRQLSERRLREVMVLANEQAEWNRRTRDLIATARRCPVRVGDILPAVMVPQWHRGTGWGRDAARALHDEVEALVRDGAAVCDGERARLMWIGRGLWFDLSLYRRFEASHQAVFVWSMYLAVAADGYLRHGDDPLRTLAGRFAAFTDQLYTPPWSVEWYVHQARSHRVDGVVHLVSEDGRGSWFTTRALERAGIPVLELRTDNVDARGYDPSDVDAAVTAWLEERVVRAG